MPLRKWLQHSKALAGAPGARALTCAPGSLRPLALDVSASGSRLLSLWADPAPDAAVHTVFMSGAETLQVDVPLAAGETRYPRLADIFPVASRLQRAAADLCGIRADDTDRRPWLRHSSWPADFFPLAEGHPSRHFDAAVDSYEFVRVAGDGVHEIPVGPVHAGIIEPGHFRFSVVGEKVLKLEERLGYVHKGIELRFAGMPLAEGHRLAARISGDSAVAFSWAYAQALEGMAETNTPPRALWLRALALEAERIANHLGDLGALGNDAGFAFGLAQFSRLKENWLRALQSAFAQRYLFDFIVPGGVAHDVPAPALEALVDCARSIAAETRLVRGIYDEHPGVRDRFAGTGLVPPALAQRMGMIGLAARASGQRMDLRVDAAGEPYAALGVRPAFHDDGDVAARVAVRFDEIDESVRLVALIASDIPSGTHRTDVRIPEPGSIGLGLVEGWRGPVSIALKAGGAATIARCHPHDPSWQNWPLLEHAVMDNIVPDFPLINKSFNLSYSGHDL
jgi:Ni,Fe-hydrogenase III large subunit